MKFFDTVSEMLDDDDVVGRSSVSDSDASDFDSDNCTKPISHDLGDMGD